MNDIKRRIKSPESRWIIEHAQDEQESMRVEALNET